MVTLTPNQLRWVEALESGHYWQSHSVLTEIDPANGKVMGHCCLGVACELMVKDGLLKIKDEPLSGLRHYYTEDDDEPSMSALLDNSAAQEWLGVNSNNPRIGGQLATYLNDTGRLSFADIAAEARERGIH